MANLKASLIFDAAQFANDAKKAVQSLNAQFAKVTFDGKKIAAEVDKIAKNIKIKPIVELPEGSIAKFKADLKDLTAKRNLAIGADVVAFNKQIGEAKKSVKELEAQGNKTKSVFAGNFLGNIQALGLVEAGKAMAHFGQESIDAFLRAEKASSQLTAALKNAGLTSESYRKELDEQATALSELTAVDDDTISAVQAQGLNFGLTGKALADYTKGVLDYSAGTGKDAVAASLKFGKALKDNTEIVDDNGEAVGKVGDIFQKFKGQAEEFGNSAGGAAQRAKNDFENFQESVGKVLSGIGGKILPTVQAFAPLFLVAPSLGISFASVSAAASSMWTAITGPIGLVVLAIVGVIAVFVLLYNKVEFVKTFIDGVLAGIVAGFHAVVDTIRGLFVDLDAEREADAEKEKADREKRGKEELAAINKQEDIKNAALIAADKKRREEEAKNKKKAAPKVKEEKVGAFAGPSLKELQDAQFKMDEIRKKGEAELAKFLEDQRLSANEKELRDAQNLFDEKITLAQLLGQSTVELEQRKLDELNRINDKHLDDQVRMEKEAAGKKKQIDDAVNDSKIEGALSVASKARALFGENTAAAKIAGIAEATINTYNAATKDIATYPFPFGAIAAGLDIAFGLAQVSKIAGVQTFHEGTDYFTPPNGQREGYALLERGERVVSAKDNASGNSNQWLAKELSRLNDRLDAGIATQGSLRVETIARTHTDNTAIVSAVKKVEYQRMIGSLQ